jgi:hypothetical protein
MNPPVDIGAGLPHGNGVNVAEIGIGLTVFAIGADMPLKTDFAASGRGQFNIGAKA